MAMKIELVDGRYATTVFFIVVFGVFDNITY
jgi:hypothetical protein